MEILNTLKWRRKKNLKRKFKKKKNDKAYLGMGGKREEKIIKDLKTNDRLA